MKLDLNSENVIGNVDGAFDREIENYRKKYGKDADWASFYNGWIMGRLNLMKMIEDGKVRLLYR